MKEIRYISTPFEGQIIALAEFEKAVQVIDLSTFSTISEFDTVLSFGGRRLAISEEGNICVAGAWARHGICGYETNSGKLIWQRKDLKKVQHIQTTRTDKNRIFAQFEIGASRFIDINTGADIEKINGAILFFESKFVPINIVDKSTKIEIIERNTKRMICKVERQSFATLDTAILPDSFVVSEAGGPLSCYDIFTGQLKWRRRLNEDGHYLKIAYNEKLEQLIGVTHSFMAGGNKKLHRININSGNLEKAEDIDNPTEIEFVMDGQMLVTSDKELRNLETDKKKNWA